MQLITSHDKTDCDGKTNGFMACDEFLVGNSEVSLELQCFTAQLIAKLQIKPKSKSNQTKNLERLYIWVVVRSGVATLVATLVITASSHFKCCPAEQT